MRTLWESEDPFGELDILLSAMSRTISSNFYLSSPVLVPKQYIGANVVRAHERFPYGGRRSGH